MTHVTGGCYATAMLEDAQLEPLIDPALGIVLGYPWGTDCGDFLADHPDAVLTRDEGDVQDYELPGAFRLFGVPVTATFQFSLDQLITVALDIAVPLDPSLVEHLVVAVAQLFEEELDDTDDGLVSAEEGPTRMSFDLYDARLTFEDLEP